MRVIFDSVRWNSSAGRRARLELAGRFGDRVYFRSPPSWFNRPSSHHGHELRFMLDDQDQVLELQRLLREVGIRPGRAFSHRSVWRVPVYGREATDHLRAELRARPRPLKARD